MSPTYRVLAGEKRQRFFAQLRSCIGMPQADLIRVASARGQYSPRARAAALRVLTAGAPLEVTQGRCFCERRRLVRKHYGI